MSLPGAPSAQNSYVTIEDELVELFERMVSELPPGVASIQVSKPRSGGVVVSLKPQSPKAALAGAHAENGLDLIDFWFGDYPVTWELPTEGQNPKADKGGVLGEVRELCRAVAAGNCAVRFGILSITGEVIVGKQPYRVTSFFECHPLLFLRNRTHRYSPYF